MFYLLNSLYSTVWNKRIVCDKQLLDSYKERGIDYRGEPEIEIYQNPLKKLELHIIGKCKDDSKYIYANEGIVENQSENVYDLINWNEDLIKVNDNIYECRVLPNWRLTILSENNYLVDAIYKPDEKGNYIKVWEKKNG